MEAMLREANPGLARRFQLSAAWEFEDYSDEDLLHIMREAARARCGDDAPPGNAPPSVGVRRRGTGERAAHGDPLPLGNALGGGEGCWSCLIAGVSAVTATNPNPSAQQGHTEGEGAPGELRASLFPEHPARRRLEPPPRAPPPPPPQGTAGSWACLSCRRVCAC
jgi:hypothetical protein